MLEKKRKFECPVIETIIIDSVDVIATSGDMTKNDLLEWGNEDETL